MPFSLISGPVGSGKTRTLLDILGKVSDRRSALYLVPSESTAAELRALVLAESDRPLLGDIFLSWPGFMRRLAAITTPVLPRTHLTMLIHRMLSTHPLRYFSSDAVSMGIAREFASTILTLKHNLIDPAMLRNELATRGSLKENDLLTVYERYEDERRKLGIVDEGDVTLAAAANLCAENGQGLAEIETLLVDEFYTVAPGMRRMLEILAENYPDLAVHMTLPRPGSDDDPFAPMWMRTIASVEKFADDHEVRSSGRDPAHDVLGYVARSPSVELRSLVRMIIDRAEGGTKLSELCVALRTGDHDLEMLLDECERYGLISSACPLSAPMAAPIMHKILAPESTAKLKIQDTVAGYAKQTMEALRAMQVPSSWRADLVDTSKRFAASRNIASIAHLEQLLRSLVTSARTLGIGTIDRGSFVDMLHESLSSQPSWGSIGNALPFAVRSLETPPATTMACTFVPHMVEGHIPQIGTERLFFGEMDEWGDAHSSVLDEIFIGTEEKLAREAALLHALHAKTRESLILTHPAVSRSGGDVVPSSFLDIVGDAVFVEVEPDIAASMKSRTFDKRLRDTVEIEGERLRGHAVHPEYHGIVVDKRIGGMVRKRYTGVAMSPTSLERYAECPFQFLVEKVLAIKPEEEVTPEILPKDRGTIIHAVLERFFRDHAKEFRAGIAGDKGKRDLKKTVDELVDRAFLEHASLIGYASSSLDDYQRRSVATLVMQVILMEVESARGLPDPLLPAEFEWFFGEGDRPALTVDVPEGEPALVKGRVDRVDRSSDGRKFIVADYKTGRSVDSVKKKILDGLHLQLPLYLEAAHRFLYPDAIPLGGILIGVQQAEKKHGFLKKENNGINYDLSGRLATVLADDAWDAALDAALAATGSYVAEIRRGRFPTAPRSCNDFCSYKDICRYHEEAD